LELQVIYAFDTNKPKLAIFHHPLPNASSKLELL
jgi:hypothetical protein